ncbi:unnamed protein product, partial [marine sediment metagenome]
EGNPAWTALGAPLDDTTAEAQGGVVGTYGGAAITLATRTNTIAAETELDLVTNTPTFDSSSRAFAAFIMHCYAGTAETIKARLYMGGVEVAESAYLLATADRNWVVLKDTAVLSGEQVVKGSVYNYDAGDARTLVVICQGNADESPDHLQSAEIVVGSFKN